MPVIICPHCDERQTVSRDLAGLTATCTGCGEGIRIPLAAPKPPKSASSPKVVIDEPEISGTDLRKTVLLLGGLIVGVLLVLGVLLYAVSPSKKETPPTAPTTATTKAATPPEREPVWAKPTAEREPSGSGSVVAGLLGLGYLVLVFLTVLIIAYAVGVFGLGVVLARDASARGLPPLPWVAAYFLFHAVGPSLGLAVATPLLFSFPPLGVLAGLVLGLGASWYGGLTYLAVRRPGKKSACPRCRNRRLAYLMTCPHCGLPETP